VLHAQVNKSVGSEEECKQVGGHEPLVGMPWAYALLTINNLPEQTNCLSCALIQWYLVNSHSPNINFERKTDVI